MWNRETIIGTASIPIGIGGSWMLELFGHTTLALILATILIIGGVVFLIYGLRKKQKLNALKNEPSELWQIIPILQRMDRRNMELSKKQKSAKFRYDIITEDYIDVFGYKFQLNNLDDIPRMVSEWETYVNKNFPEGIFSIDLSQIILMRAIYECIGLKNHRADDKRFRILSTKLDTYRNEVTDTKLNDLIQLHIYTSDYCSSLLLLNKIPENDKKEFIQKLPQNWRVRFQSGSMEIELKETMNDIRVKIRERIKGLERV